MITIKKLWLDSVTDIDNPTRNKSVTGTRNQDIFEEIQDDEMPF
jgi:hypothetical protein